MSVDTKLQYDQDYIKQFSQKNGEPEWLTQFRLDALAKAEDLPMPRPDKTKIDNWNFTQFKHDSSGEKINSLDELPEKIKSLIDLEETDRNLLVLRNNAPAFSSLSEELKNKGVIFTDMLTAAKEHGDLLKKHFMKDAVKVDEHRLTALHAALMNGGAFVYIPQGVELETPFQAVFWQDDAEAALFNHVLLVAEDNSSVTYVENYISTGNGEASTVANLITEAIVGENAKVSYGAVDTLGEGVTGYVNRRGRVGRDGKLEWALGQMNDGNTVSENLTYLIGDGSYGDAKTVTVGKASQKQNFTTNITHFGKNSEGYILKHAVVKDSATSVFNGIGKIEHGASGSNAEQESRVLMLSENARGDANPILLIDEDDVTAGHAASVGRVDPIQLYYLMSRGITKHEAERLVIHGFLAPVVKELPIETVKKQLVEVIERKVKK
ncbi:Fe-S cluster assembly protein SufD [Bacillus marinisedimentorum]|uniref:Fe-S cluster assembly protein SufD n=1 Tax=Bacillus marinisedimentorum TaxID=1821260 RepID=UPI000872AB1B|nr:Fe-S cluster assembly protein SufD [Bacillus marinisedimentorum]